ncbi:Protein YIG1 [Nakaseomyces bracarensis]|uniref:Protein YIG1 n=1 Tax=Nakaseomyces bracarensis TaxID=273131 RepID=A0ABR4NVU7_9SACH
MGLPITLYQEDLNGLQLPQKRNLDQFIRERFPSVVYPGINDLRSLQRRSGVIPMQPLSPNVRQEIYSYFVNNNNNTTHTTETNDRYDDFEWNFAMDRWNLENNLTVECSATIPDLSSYKTERNYNNTLWLYYTESNSYGEFYLYDTINCNNVKIHLDHSMIESSDVLTAIDANQINDNCYHTLLGFKSGKLILITTSLDSGTQQNSSSRDMATSRSTSDIIYESRTSTHPIRSNARYNGILEVNASLLPEYALSFNIKEGLIVNKLSDGSLHKVTIPYNATDFADVEGSELIAKINFPQFVLSNGVQVWNYDNILQINSADFPVDHEVKFWLKPDERIRNIMPLPYRDHLFLVTSERGVSVPLNPDSNLSRGRSVGANGPSYTEVTNVLPVFSLTEYNDNQYQVESFNNDKYLLVAQQHLYSTSLTIYQNCSRNHDWYTLGFIDIRTKFNISKVKQMAVLDSQPNGPPQLTIHCDDGSIRYFNITI